MMTCPPPEKGQTPILYILLAIGLACLPARGLAGTHLDSSFATQGILLSTSPLGGEVAVGYSVAIDASNRILVAGVLSDSTGTFHMAVWRFDPRGRLDPGFGTNGVARSPDEDWGWAMTLDSRGRIVVAGFSGNDWRKSERAVIRRFLPDGRSDPDFGFQGVAVSSSPLGGSRAAAYAIATGPNDNIIVAGDAAGPQQETHATLWRFMTDGRLDQKFGRAGAAVLPMPEDQGDARSNALAVDNEAILVAGTMRWKSLALWKISWNGLPREDFGRGGLAVNDWGMGRGIVTAAENRIWVGGFSYARKGDKVVGELAVLSRFLADGVVDEAYATKGVKILPLSKGVTDQESFAIIQSQDGRLYLAGYAGDKSLVQACFWALTPKGELSPRFGERGVLVLPNASGGKEDRVYALTMDREGRLLGTGFSRGSDRKMHLAIWRLRP